MLAVYPALRNALVALFTAMLTVSAIGQDVAPPQNLSGAQAKPEAQKCTLGGMVVNTLGGAPVRKATVRLIPQRQTMYDEAQTTATDAEGRFLFGELAAGRYMLVISHPSFVSQMDPRRSGAPGTTYELAPGQEVKDVVVRLMPGAVLRGRVTDEDGDAVAQAQIEVLHAKSTARTGQDPRQVAGGGSTDDQGEFRVFSLAPGRYYIKAVPAINGDANAARSRKVEERAYVPTFYPAAASRETATPVDLRGGDEVSVSIALVRANVYPVTGTLRNEKGGLVSNGMVMAMQSMGAESNSPVREGKFELRVPAGHYSLMAVGIDEGFSTGQQPPRVHKTIDVPEGGLRDVELVLGAGKAAAADVTGRIRAEGGGSLPQRHSLYVVLQPMNAQKSDPEEGDVFADMTNGGGFALMKADGTFEMKDVAPGTYEVVLGSQSSGLEDWYTKSIFVGPRDELNSGITVSGSVLQLDIVVSAKAEWRKAP